MSTTLTPPPRIRSLLAERAAAHLELSFDIEDWSDASRVALVGVARGLEQLEAVSREGVQSAAALERFRRSILTLLSDLEARAEEPAA